MLTLPRQVALLTFLFALTAAVARGAPDDASPPEGASDRPASAASIIQQASPQVTDARYGPPIATRYRVGAKVVAKGGAVQDIFVMVATPLECPEQEVHVVEEEFTPNVESVEFRTLPDVKLAEPGARQMLINVPTLAAKMEASALVTYEVLTRPVLPPQETDSLRIPLKPDRSLKPYLSNSPLINVGERKIRDAVRAALTSGGAKDDDVSAGEPVIEAEEASAKERDADEANEEVVSDDEADADESATVAAPDKAAAAGVGPSPSHSDDDAQVASAADCDWRRIEAIYDYVREHVQYEDGAEDKSATQALKDGRADCHGMSALFVAMCRAAKTPARMVWVDGHQYAEFYLEDETGKGHWYPAQLAGTRAFGEMPTPLVILQKGDNFRVPERRRERLRYASDYTTLLAAPKFQPKVTYVREQL